jgi:hypothetical protein
MAFVAARTRSTRGVEVAPTVTFAALASIIGRLRFSLVLDCSS